MDRRYHFDRTAYNDPKLPDDHIEEWVEEWNFQKALSIRRASADLAERAAAEFAAYADKLEAERGIKSDKLQALREKQELVVRKLSGKLEGIREKQRQKQLDLELEERAMIQAQEEMFERLRNRPIPADLRFEHTHILGPSGSGKTSLIQNIILDDLFLVDEDATEKDSIRKVKGAPAYIVIDPKGQMIERLARLDEFSDSPWRDRLIIIDPFDAPGLNLFDPTGLNPAQIVSHFSYIFSTTKQQFTGKQLPCFSFCVRLHFTIPHADLYTLLDLLDDRTNKKPSDPRFVQAIANLTQPNQQSARRFFENDFYNANYASTREEIKSRVWGILSDEYLPAMFNASARKLNLRQCIQNRKIVLVNTRMAALKEAHQTLGRYILALTLDAIESRADIPQSQWHPVFIVIDEFQQFAESQKTPEMLRLIREYRGGMTLAHQNMYCDELDDSIRAVISTNTAIKYCSKPGGMDISYMARDLQCEPEFLTKVCVKTATDARFGCYFPGLEHPFLVGIPLGAITTSMWPTMADQQYRDLRARNKQNLYAPPIVHKPISEPRKPPPPQPPKPPPPPPTARPSGPHLRTTTTSLLKPNKSSDDSSEPSDSWS